MEEEIQELIRNLLKEKNMTERELALSIGTSQSRLNKLKNGNLNMKTFNTISKLIAMSAKENNLTDSQKTNSKININIDCRIIFD